MNSLCAISIKEAAGLISAHKVKPSELVEAHIERINATDDKLNSFVTILSESALQSSFIAEKEIMNGNYRGPIHGIPIGLKDLYDTAGTITTVGSKIYRKRLPQEDATVVSKLKEAGAIVVGKLQMHEFALGATSINPHDGPARNPWDTERITGGSSGGSASSVAAGQCMASLGTDTGGSIRIPSALCGIVGLKPTFGRVSRKGVFPLSWTMDTVGPMTRTVEDAALMLNAMVSFDPSDPGSSPHETEDFTSKLGLGIKGLTIGVPQEYFYETTSPEVKEALNSAEKVFESLGAKVIPISIPVLEHSLAISGTIMLTEAASVHERNLKDRPFDIGDDVRLRLTQGSLYSAVDYLKAQRGRHEFNNQIDKAMETVDILLAPTVGIGAPKIDDKTVVLNGVEYPALALMPRLTRPHNICGLPTISIPCGFTSSGLPIGMQLAGRAFEDSVVIQTANAYENATGWTKQSPVI